MATSSKPISLVAFVLLVAAAAVTAGPASSQPTDDPPTPTGLSPASDPGAPLAPNQPRNIKTLKFMLPAQHVDDAVTGVVRHFYLRGWTERLSESCDETWCGKLVLGERLRVSGVHKTIELPPDPLGGCDREWLVMKSRRGARFERYCQTGANVFLEREKGFSGASAGLRRDFLNDGSSEASRINDGYVWARTREGSGGIGLTNTFMTELFEGCSDESVDGHPAATAVLFFGPFNLNRKIDRERAAEILGPYPASDAADYVEEMRSLADAMGRPGHAVHILIRREFWGPYDSNRLCAGRAAKEACFEFSEDYVSARVGRRPLRLNLNSSTVGRIGWQVRRSDEESGPHEAWRRSLFVEIIHEEDSYLLPRQAACLPESSSRSRREFPLTGPMPGGRRSSAGDGR